jgi:UDP-glucose 4-epimerase
MERQYLEVNAHGTACVARASRDEGVSTFIYASSAYVYGASRSLPMTEAHPTTPMTPYAASKLAGEQFVVHSAASGGQTAIIARLANVYASDSPPDTIVGQAIRQVSTGRMTFRDHAPIRDFIHVDDVVEALFRLPSSVRGGCTVVNVSTSESASIGQLAEIVADTAFAFGIREARVDPPRSGTSDPVPAIVLDTMRLYAITGWRPTISLREGLRRVLRDVYGAERRAMA